MPARVREVFRDVFVPIGVFYMWCDLRLARDVEEAPFLQPIAINLLLESFSTCIMGFHRDEELWERFDVVLRTTTPF